jgi:hypothetical protein
MNLIFLLCIFIQLNNTTSDNDKCTQDHQESTSVSPMNFFEFFRIAASNLYDIIFENTNDITSAYDLIEEDKLVKPHSEETWKAIRRSFKTNILLRLSHHAEIFDQCLSAFQKIATKKDREAMMAERDYGNLQLVVEYREFTEDDMPYILEEIYQKYEWVQIYTMLFIVLDLKEQENNDFVKDYVFEFGEMNRKNLSAAVPAEIMDEFVYDYKRRIYILFHLEPNKHVFCESHPTKYFKRLNRENLPGYLKYYNPLYDIDPSMKKLCSQYEKVYNNPTIENFNMLEDLICKNCKLLGSANDHLLLRRCIFNTSATAYDFTHTSNFGTEHEKKIIPIIENIIQEKKQGMD